MLTCAVFVLIMFNGISEENKTGIPLTSNMDNQSSGYNLAVPKASQLYSGNNITTADRARLLSPSVPPLGPSLVRIATVEPIEPRNPSPGPGYNIGAVPNHGLSLPVEEEGGHGSDEHLSSRWRALSTAKPAYIYHNTYDQVEDYSNSPALDPTSWSG